MNKENEDIFKQKSLGDNPGIRYTYQHPNFIKQRRQQTVSDKLFINDQMIACDEALDLFESGGCTTKVLHTELQKDKHYLEASFNSLVCSAPLAVINKIIKEFPKDTDIIEFNILNDYFNNNIKQSEYSILKTTMSAENKISNIFLAAFTERFLNNSSQAITYLDGEENDLDAALLYSSFWNKTKKALKCLERYEERAIYYFEWRDLAISWKNIFNDDDEAIRCLRRAEEQVKYDSEWYSIALVWKQLFDNDAEAMRCLKQVEKNTDSCLEWCGIATHWKDIFNDDAEVLRCLRLAKENIEDSHDEGYVNLYKTRLGFDGDL